MDTVTVREIEQAQARIRGKIHRTPVLTCQSLNEIFGAEIFFKCENFQKVGAFKFRGATNAVFSLSDDEAGRGVATHSSGNHGQALALAARLRGIKAHIVMPKDSSEVKIAAVRGYGGTITFCEPTQQSRQKTLDEVVEQTGAKFIHPYDNCAVIAGQGTVALELIEEIANLDLIIAPVGGGGLLSGTGLIAKSKSNVQAFGAEPAIANDAYLSLRDGKLHPTHNSRTIGDGLRSSLSERTFAIIRGTVDEILLANEETIMTALWLILERMKIVVEPSAAVPLAALLENKAKIRGRRVGIILSGGNVALRDFRRGELMDKR